MKTDIFQETINADVANWSKGLYEWQREREEMIEKEE